MYQTFIQSYTGFTSMKMYLETIYEHVQTIGLLDHHRGQTEICDVTSRILNRQ